MATPISFPDVNKNLGRPASMTDAECQSLPIFTDGRTCISCWQLSEEELRAVIQSGGKIWLGVLSGVSQPPVFVQADCPIIYSTGPMPEPLPALTAEYDNALATIADRLPGPADMHLRNLREAYEQGGQPAVVKYLQPYEAYLTQPAQ